MARIRMLVLLHFYSLGYTPFMLAFLFLLYETAGIFANLGGGWLATRFGIPRMLMTGLSLQIAGLLLLSALDPAWSAAFRSPGWSRAQGIAGVAKDLTKTASKSAIKATSEGGSGQLFNWVAWFTGSKNAMKGAGFFVGGLLLETMGFRGALWLMAALLALILLGVAASLPRTLGKAKASKSFRELFAKTRSINLHGGGAHVPVRLARCVVRRRPAGVSLQPGLALHGSRRLHRELDDRLRARAGDRAIGHPPQRRRPVARSAGGAALGCRAHRHSARAGARARSNAHVARLDLVVTVGLGIFGFAFAVISSLHSYLILAYAGSEKAAEDVGFYYAANAGGRLIGILLSGVLTQTGGLAACLWGSTAMLAFAW